MWITETTRTDYFCAADEIRVASHAYNIESRTALACNFRVTLAVACDPKTRSQLSVIITNR